MIIIDMIMMKNQGDYKSIETQLFFDMTMMIFAAGRERDENEWELEAFLGCWFQSLQDNSHFGFEVPH